MELRKCNVTFVFQDQYISLAATVYPTYQLFQMDVIVKMLHKLEDTIDHLTLRYKGTEKISLLNRIPFVIPASEDHQVGYLLQDKIRVSLQEGEQQCAETVHVGEMYFIPPHCTCTLMNLSTLPANTVLIRFDCTSFSDQRTAPLLQKSEVPDSLRLHTSMMPQAHNWLDDFASANENPHTELFYKLQSYLYAIAAALVSAAGRQQTKSDHLPDYVEQIQLYMEEHYRETLDIEELALSSGASTSRFYRAFKQSTGISPRKYMTKIRLESSLRLLSGTSSSVIHVAHSVGYEDEYYFSRLFKKEMGITPTEYAMKAKIRIANLSPIFHGDLTALGITPRISLNRGWSKHPETALKQIERCEPQIILTSPIPDDVHRALLDIAPTVMLYWK